MEKKANRFIKVFPWQAGFVSDLLFYISIDTLFLTLVKNFSAAQIFSISSFSQFICIALQFPVLFVIKRIGNTASIRTGSFFLLMSSIIITFGRSYYLVLLGRVFHDVAVIFRSATYVALENNLDLVGRRKDFVKVRTAANTVYAVLTLLISFVASYMFNLNHYLPMFGCIACCSIGFALSLFMKDCSNYNKITYKKEKGEKVKLQYSKFIILAIVVYSLFYPIVTIGQDEGKLFIQQELFLDFNENNTSLILGAIICISRFIRVFSNVVFARLYHKYQAKMGVVLPILLSSSIACLLFGSFIPLVLIKIFIMALGYIIILFVRDPFRLYMQDILFESTPKEQHQTLLTLLEFGVKVGTAGIGLVFSAVLISSPMWVVMAIILPITIIEIFLSIKLYNMFMTAKIKKEKELQPA